MKRFGKPEDLLDLMLWLPDENYSGFVTGEQFLLMVDLWRTQEYELSDGFTLPLTYLIRREG